MSKEKTYTIPLRKEFQKAPKYRRAKKAVSAIRIYLSKHLKSEEVKIGNSINLKVWERGIKNPPHKLKVTALKDDKGVVKAELFGVKIQEEKSEETKEKESKKEIKEEKPKAEEKESTQSSKTASAKKLEQKSVAKSKTSVKKETKKKAPAKKPSTSKK